MNAGWTNTDPYTVTGPTSGITALSLNTADDTDAIAGLTAGSASVSQHFRLWHLAVNGPITTSGNVAISGYSAVDFESTVPRRRATSPFPAWPTLPTGPRERREL